MNAEDQTYIILVTNLVLNLCILVRFIGNFLYKRIKLYLIENTTQIEMKIILVGM
jgi:hypothetical protein